MSLSRCWVCSKCSIVSYHQINYCPNCPGKMDRVVDEANKLRELYGRETGFIPAEPDYEFTKAGKQPWVVKESEHYDKFVKKIALWIVNQDYGNLRSKYCKDFRDSLPEDIIKDYHEFEKKVFEARDNKYVPLDYLEELLQKRIKEKDGDYRINLHSLKSLSKEMNDNG